MAGCALCLEARLDGSDIAFIQPGDTQQSEGVYSLQRFGRF